MHLIRLSSICLGIDIDRICFKYNILRIINYKMTRIHIASGSNNAK